MRRDPFLCSGAMALTLMLAGCGGGGTSVANIPPPETTPTPTPTPPPTPTPDPTPPPADYEPVVVFPSVTKTTDFSAVGIEANHYTEDGSLNTVGFAVRYDADSGVYVMSVPTAQNGQFYSNASSEQYWDGELRNPSFSDGVEVSVLKPGTGDPQFTYSSLASYYTFGSWPGNYGWFAFGTPTPASAVPVTGSATYSALVQGSPGWAAVLEGTGTFNFDFGAGLLSGHLDFAGSDPAMVGTYDFANTVFGVGSTSFSGDLTNPGFSQTGSFSGNFTGPHAEELISTWTAPFHNPLSGQDSMGFGVLVGKRP